MLARKPAPAAAHAAGAASRRRTAWAPAATVNAARAAARNPPALIPPGAPCASTASLPPRRPNTRPPRTGPASVAAVSAKAPASAAT